MVAEKNGIIRFYDLVSQQPIMSLSAGQVPLISADWCKTNALKVGAVASDDWLIWDMSKSRYVTLKFVPDNIYTPPLKGVLVLTFPYLLKNFGF